MHRSVPNDRNGQGWVATALGGLGLGLMIAAALDGSGTWLLMKVVIGVIGLLCALTGARITKGEDRVFSVTRLILAALTIAAGAAPLYLDGFELPAEVSAGLAAVAILTGIVAALRRGDKA